MLQRGEIPLVSTHFLLDLVQFVHGLERGHGVEVKLLQFLEQQTCLARKKPELRFDCIRRKRCFPLKSFVIPSPRHPVSSSDFRRRNRFTQIIELGLFEVGQHFLGAHDNGLGQSREAGDLDTVGLSAPPSITFRRNRI